MVATVGAGVKVQSLRELMKANGVSGYVIPMGDAHSSEYVAAADKRIEFISGFTGSAGTALVTEDKALLWTDGRYFTQAAEQFADSEWELMRSAEPGVPTLEEFVAAEQVRCGVDPALVSLMEAEQWTARGCEPLALLPENLVDKVWACAQPARPSERLRPHAAAVAGESAASKLTRVGAALESEACDAIVLNALDQMCWLFNLRGADIECNPVFLSYAVIRLGAKPPPSASGAASEPRPVHATLFVRCLDADVADIATAVAVRTHLEAEGCAAAA